jgi:hypothetical protein
MLRVLAADPEYRAEANRRLYDDPKSREIGGTPDRPRG